MSSARNHAKRSHRSYHAMKANTSGSVRRTLIRNYAKPPRQASFFSRLFSRIAHKGSYTGGEA